MPTTIYSRAIDLITYFGWGQQYSGVLTDGTKVTSEYAVRRELPDPSKAPHNICISCALVCADDVGGIDDHAPTAASARIAMADSGAVPNAIDWNDAPERTQQDVIALLRKFDAMERGMEEGE